MVSVTIDRLSVELGRRTVLHDVSAAVQAGEFVGIIGPNGAGKSTLVRAMLGPARRQVGLLIPREHARTRAQERSRGQIGHKFVVQRVDGGHRQTRDTTRKWNERRDRRAISAGPAPGVKQASAAGQPLRIGMEIDCTAADFPQPAKRHRQLRPRSVTPP